MDEIDFKAPLPDIYDVGVKELAKIEDALARVNATLFAARSKAAVDGEYSDREWYAKTISFQKRLGSRHQQLMRHLKALRTQHNIESQNGFTHQFLVVCKRRLNPELYESLLAEAKEMSEEKP